MTILADKAEDMLRRKYVIRATPQETQIRVSYLQAETRDLAICIADFVKQEIMELQAENELLREALYDLGPIEREAATR